jgi:lipoyl(octanoyl) transferase
VLQFGTVDYATGLRLQKQLVDLRKREKIGDVLLLLEHTPVITLGRNANASNVIASTELLQKRGVEIFESDRGGDVTFHGPGQLVGYPIFDLRGFAQEGHGFSRGDKELEEEAASDTAVTLRKHLGAVDFVRSLEEVLIRTCADFSLHTKRICDLTGVWTDAQSLSSRTEDNDSLAKRPPMLTAGHADAKLAAIGVHISRFVTSHGFALNVNTDLSYFNLIVPCGITSKPVTSMERELGRTLNLNAVSESISRNFGVVFRTQILWLESLDALFGRTVVPVKAASEIRRVHDPLS